jgi:hypothetical protein
MTTASQLLPLAIGVAVVGLVTWFLLMNEWALGPWLLAALLFAHGWVHLMFVFPAPEPAVAAAGGPAWPFDMGRSWLIGGVGLDAALVRVVGVALMAIVMLGFSLAALATIGVLVPAGWWPGLVAGSAVASMILLTLFFSPVLLLGYAIDVTLVWFALASAWSPAA